MKKNFIFLILAAFLLFSITNVHALNYETYFPILENAPVVNTECQSIGSLTEWIKNAFTIVRFVGVGLAVVLTALDFIGVVGGSKDDDLKKAFDRTVKRVVALILLLLTTVIVQLIISIANPVVKNGTNPSIPNCTSNV